MDAVSKEVDGGGDDVGEIYDMGNGGALSLL